MVAPADCNNTATLKFRVVDLRLQSNDSLSACSQESRVELIGQNERRVFGCEKGKFLYGFDDFHISNENGMVLYLYKKAREYPTNIWLEVQSKYFHCLSKFSLFVDQKYVNSLSTKD